MYCEVNCGQLIGTDIFFICWVELSKFDNG